MVDKLVTADQRRMPVIDTDAEHTGTLKTFRMPGQPTDPKGKIIRGGETIYVLQRPSLEEDDVL